MSIPRDGPHLGIDCKFECFSEFEFIFEKALGYESGGWRTCFDEKNQRQNFSCQCPFKVCTIWRQKKKIPMRRPQRKTYELTYDTPFNIFTVVLELGGSSDI